MSAQPAGLQADFDHSGAGAAVSDKPSRRRPGRRGCPRRCGPRGNGAGDERGECRVRPRCGGHRPSPGSSAASGHRRRGGAARDSAPGSVGDPWPRTQDRGRPIPAVGNRPSADRQAGVGRARSGPGQHPRVLGLALGPKKRRPVIPSKRLTRSGDVSQSVFFPTRRPCGGVPQECRSPLSP